MQIPANPALLAAQNFASAQSIQPSRPASAPRRIDAFDLADLASKPDAAVKAAAGSAAPRVEAPPQRSEQRPLRPGSTLDIKV
jgi:hypothetical protein